MEIKYLHAFLQCVSPGSLLAQVSVPFDLVKKHPKGQQTFALKTKDVVIGTLTTEVKPNDMTPSLFSLTYLLFYINAGLRNTGCALSS